MLLILILINCIDGHFLSTWILSPDAGAGYILTIQYLNSRLGILAVALRSV